MRRPIDPPINVTTEFGEKDSNAKFGYHSGVDYGVGLNRPVYAPISGQLTNIITNTGGNMVVIFDGQYYHRLMHNQSFSRGNGWVEEGNEVAKAGTTGLSTGVHVHWDINREGMTPTSFAAFINPATWLSAQGDNMPSLANSGDVTNIFRQELGREPDPGALSTYTGKPWPEVWYAVINSQERAGYLAKLRGNEAKIVELQTAITNEQNKPAKEVIKEVVKIVEKPVEVVKIVEKPVDPHWLARLKSFIREQIKRGAK